MTDDKKVKCDKCGVMITKNYLKKHIKPMVCRKMWDTSLLDTDSDSDSDIKSDINSDNNIIIFEESFEDPGELESYFDRHINYASDSEEEKKNKEK